MKEITDIIAAFKLAQQQGLKSALATVVHVEGSSYRRPGARMLVTEQGVLTGAISGGCLEGDALRKALLAIMQQQNKLVTYDTTDEDDAKFGVQLGCNGVVHILFEPIRIDEQLNALYLLEQVISERKEAVLVTLFSLTNDAQPGTSLLYKDNSIVSSLNNTMKQNVLKEIKQVISKRSSVTKKNIFKEDYLHAFIQFIPPPVAIIIAGAGNDAKPLVDITASLGWHTVVVDGRPSHATLQRFLKANKVFVSKPENVLQTLQTDAQTVAVLMSHNYNYDLALLQQLLITDCYYIGMLGPAKKLNRMLDELHNKGFILSQHQLSKIHSPVGLDIGAETAEEIAVSIVAEIKMVLEKKSGISLKNKDHSIHPRLLNSYL